MACKFTHGEDGGGVGGFRTTGRSVAIMVAENTWRCLSQGTGLSDSWGGGWCGGGFCCTPMGNSVWGRVLCHKVCSQCCKLARESYSGVKTRAEKVSDQTLRWTGVAGGGEVEGLGDSHTDG